MTLRTNVVLIALAWEGRREADHELARAIYGSMGIKLDPLKPAEPSKTHRASAAEIDAWAKRVNAKFAEQPSKAEAIAAAKERALAKASPKPEN